MYLRVEGCALSGKEVSLVDGNQLQGTTAGAEDDGIVEGGVGGNEGH